MNQKFIDAVKELVLAAEAVLSKVEDAEQVHPHDEFELRTCLSRMAMHLEEQDDNSQV